MSPEQWTWFYSHVDSDGGPESASYPLGISFGVLVLSWLEKKNFESICRFIKLSFKRVKLNRESEVLVSDMVTGVSRVNLYDATLRVVACNMECGQYVRGSEATGERSVRIQTEPYYYFLKDTRLKR